MVGDSNHLSGLWKLLDLLPQLWPDFKPGESFTVVWQLHKKEFHKGAFEVRGKWRWLLLHHESVKWFCLHPLAGCCFVIFKHFFLGARRGKFTQFQVIVMVHTIIQNYCVLYLDASAILWLFCYLWRNIVFQAFWKKMPELQYTKLFPVSGIHGVCDRWVLVLGGKECHIVSFFFWLCIVHVPETKGRWRVIGIFSFVFQAF